MEVMVETDVPMMTTAMANDNKTATNAAPMVRFSSIHVYVIRVVVI
jgi:hypothetical protein